MSMCACAFRDRKLVTGLLLLHCFVIAGMFKVPLLIPQGQGMPASTHLASCCMFPEERRFNSRRGR